MDPELLLGSGSGIKVPDPAKSERALCSGYESTSIVINPCDTVSCTVNLPMLTHENAPVNMGINVSLS